MKEEDFIKQSIPLLMEKYGMDYPLAHKFAQTLVGVVDELAKEIRKS